MPNAENLIDHRFKPGQSGNPNGRPKKLPEIEDLLLEVLGENAEGAKAILHALLRRAKKGNVRAAEILFDRAFGKVKQEIRGDFNHQIQKLVVHVIPGRGGTHESLNNLPEEFRGISSGVSNNHESRGQQIE